MLFVEIGQSFTGPALLEIIVEARGLMKAKDQQSHWCKMLAKSPWNT